jgi:recombination protein RecA
MAKGKKATVEKVTPESVMKLINKNFGAGAVKFASDPEFKITRMATGVLSVDDCLGGGFPRGRTVEIYGDFSTGKTCCALHLIAEVQRKLKGNCAYVSAERDFDSKHARHLGVKTKKLAIYPQKESGNKCIDFMETLLYSGIFDVIVLDSVAALLPEAERQAAMTDGSFGTEQAKMMSKAMRKLTTANRGNTVIVFINQTREAIGVMFGDKRITSGGKALGFYASIRVELNKIETIKKPGVIIDPKTGKAVAKDVPVAHRVQIRVRKDKTGGARQEDTSTFVYDYELGDIDPVEDLIYVGRRYGVVRREGDEKSPTWYVEGYRDEAQKGRKKFKSWLRKNIAVQEDLRDMIKKQQSSKPATKENDDD